jgi:hypothetical protein
MERLGDKVQQEKKNVEAKEKDILKLQDTLQHMKETVCEL